MTFSRRSPLSLVSSECWFSEGILDEHASVSIPLSENTKLLKERLGAIMNYKKKSKVAIASALALTLVFCFGATAVGAYTANPAIQDNANASHMGVNSEYSRIDLTNNNCTVYLETTSNRTYEIIYNGNAEQYYNVQADINNSTLNISVSKNELEQSGQNEPNSIIIKIPNYEYEQFTINQDRGVVHLPVMYSHISVFDYRGQVFLQSGEISQGIYELSTDRGTITVATKSLQSNLSLSNTRGRCKVVFDSIPQNLDLNIVNTYGQLDLPAGWHEIMTLGNGKPTITLLNDRGTSGIAVILPGEQE